MGGLCFVCLNRTEPGVVHHLAHGKVVLGEFGRSVHGGRAGLSPARRHGPQTRTHSIAALFRQAGVPCAVTDNLARAHWEKLIWNIPFNGLGVASAAGYQAVISGHLSGELSECLATDKLLADTRWEQLVRELMLEVIATAHNLGFDIPESLADEQIKRTRDMGAYKASTLIDFERGQALELESLFLEPLRHAHDAGVLVPRLEPLCQLLQQLDPNRAVGQNPLLIPDRRA